MFERRDIVSQISQHCQDSLFITGLGSASYDLHAAGDSPRNFYLWGCLLYTSPSPRDRTRSRMPSSA